jgi:hypothetical protein
MNIAGFSFELRGQKRPIPKAFHQKKAFLDVEFI